jgi:hypothetical protein
MATQITTVLVDDIDGSEGDVRAVSFAVDGTAYEVDLSAANAAALADALAPYIAAGRRVPRPRRKRGTR